MTPEAFHSVCLGLQQAHALKPGTNTATRRDMMLVCLGRTLENVSNKDIRRIAVAGNLQQTAATAIILELLSRLDRAG